jgi:hypothetical protein
MLIALNTRKAIIMRYHYEGKVIHTKNFIFCQDMKSCLLHNAAPL